MNDVSYDGDGDCGEDGGWRGCAAGVDDDDDCLTLSSLALVLVSQIDSQRS